MKSRKVIKRQHEKAVCDSLLSSLNLEAVFLKEGNDKNEPDMLYKFDSVIVGIEVGTAYYDDSDAKQEWTLATGERNLPKAGYEMREKGVMRNPDELICSRIQQIISEKSTKQYTGADDIWLCIQQRAALSDFNSMRRCSEELVVPEKHPFQHIYLIEHSSNTAMGLI